MITVVKLTVEHLKEVLSEEANAPLRALITDDKLAAIAAKRFAFAALSEETGRVLCCAGLSEYWPERAEGWAILSGNCKREMIAVHRRIQKFLDRPPVRRIEAAVELGFRAGHRWARLLGFELEAQRLKAFLPNGKDCALYARVREEK